MQLVRWLSAIAWSTWKQELSLMGLLRGDLNTISVVVTQVVQMERLAPTFPKMYWLKSWAKPLVI